MIASYPHRRFQLWEYRVSHGSLLVRSPRGPGVQSNVDLVFVGVEFLSVPRHLRGLELDHGTLADAAFASSAVGEVDSDRVYALISEGRRHLVVAAAFHVDENENEIFDSPWNLGES